MKYTAWEVDGANPMYWFIIAPYEKSTFWEWLAIYFHYSVSIISIHDLSEQLVEVYDSLLGETGNNLYQKQCIHHPNGPGWK